MMLGHGEQNVKGYARSHVMPINMATLIFIAVVRHRGNPDAAAVDLNSGSRSGGAIGRATTKLQRRRCRTRQ
jgi:hypothetical protein